MRRSYGKKLTAAQVAEIRAALATGTFSGKELAQRYCVSDSTISTIAHRTTWKDVPGPSAVRHFGPPRTNTGYFGVSGNGAMNRFVVAIRENGTPRTLGVFRDPIEAAKCYDARARALGYPRERLNFPDDADG